MIGRLSVLGFSLVTALSSSALAHEDRGSPRASHAPAAYGGYGYGGYGYGGYGYGGYGPTPAGHDGRGRGRGNEEYSARVSLDLRYADLDRNGWVSLDEALDSGRQVFRRNDRNNDRVLTRYEVGWRSVRQDDRDNDGRVSMREHQRSVRAQFASLDTNRDGYLARFELGLEPPRGARSAGWWPWR